MQQKTVHRFPQALLLLGAADLGLATFSAQLAQSLLCRVGSDAPCGRCRDCVLFAAGNHPDFFKLEPEEAGKAIKVDAARVLIQRVSQTSHSGGHQIVLIQPADELNIAAANALLKTLEEPQGSVIFILVAHERNSLPSTIVSRCQKIIFQTPDPIAAEKWLQSQAPDMDAKTLLRLADGFPLRALAFSENHFLETRDQLLHSLLELSDSIPHKIAAEWCEIPSDLFFQILFGLMLDVLNVQRHIAVSQCRNQDKVEALQKLAKIFSAKTIWQFLEALKKMREYALKGLNVHLDLMLTVALFGLKR